MSYVESLFSLKGKTALVTGTSGGIGQEIAVAYAKAGADVLLLNRGNMEETASLIEREGGTAEKITFDLKETGDIQNLTSRLLEDHEIDILVNNAGIIRRQPAKEYTEENWQDVLDVNLSAVFFLTRHLAGPMLERKQGKIINIASLLSFQGGIFVPSYTASKHAVSGLTKALANEWACDNVQVNAIAPGYIATKNTKPLRENPERSEAILSRIPAGRWGETSDLVGAALFLASPASDYVSGHTLVVDGGWMSR
ncbi:2-dehydro-3-deoxy-D-gluconate 5-dehydrogenase KduD [Rossellomorea sp. NPDC077527]|uniref:2-dehydro-3-deoxy-D-gluconate 5-dehydrogenase KduD n=1 Tax=Rossellomorea sp. NPDC077527 TaxID=3364510 RepID=UPI0037C975D3